MSVERHPFRWVPPLQHMTKIKIIESLWRNHKFGNGINKLMTWEIQQQSVPPQVFDPISDEFQSKIDDLEIPEKLKIDLKYILEQMMHEAINWLVTTHIDNPEIKELDEGWVEAIDYFVYNLCFNNFGCVDGRKTLESYVRGKESIGYWVWHELCLYCIEDKILEFSEKFNWQKSSSCLNWQCPVYWYRKICGQLPSDEMLTFSHHLQRDKTAHVGAFSNEKNIVRSMLEALTTIYSESRSVAAIAHFQNQLNNDDDDDDEFNKLVSNSLLRSCGNGEVFIYMLRSITKDFSLESISYRANQLMAELVKWPWIFFIDDWIRLFETNISGVFFISFFHRLGLAIPNMRGHFKEVLYRVFERIVIIFHERFISNYELIAEAFWNIFFKEDAGYLCTLMLKGVKSYQRKFVIEAMRRYVRVRRLEHKNIFYNSYTREKSFSLQETADQVFSGEVREFFREIYDQYCS